LRHVAAVLFVVMVTFTIGGQSYFFQQYNAYLNVDVSVFASNFMDSVVNQLVADLGNYLRAKLPPFCLALLLVWAARRVVRPRRAARANRRPWASDAGAAGRSRAVAATRRC
jgi:hypothetical protein